MRNFCFTFARLWIFFGRLRNLWLRINFFLVISFSCDNFSRFVDSTFAAAFRDCRDGKTRRVPEALSAQQSPPTCRMKFSIEEKKNFVNFPRFKANCVKSASENKKFHSRAIECLNQFSSVIIINFLLSSAKRGGRANVKLLNQDVPFRACNSRLKPESKVQKLSTTRSHEILK